MFVTSDDRKLDVIKWDEPDPVKFLQRLGNEGYFPGFACDWNLETRFSKLKATRKMAVDQTELIKSKLHHSLVFSFIDLHIPNYSSFNFSFPFSEVPYHVQLLEVGPNGRRSQEEGQRELCCSLLQIP